MSMVTRVYAPTEDEIRPAVQNAAARQHFFSTNNKTTLTLDLDKSWPYALIRHSEIIGALGAYTRLGRFQNAALADRVQRAPAQEPRVGWNAGLRHGRLAV